MRSGWAFAACFAIGWTLLAGAPPARGQVPPPGQDPVAEAAPAVIDTVVANLRWPAAWAEPRTFLVGPDTLRLGDELLVGVDVPDTLTARPDSLLAGDQDWLVATGWRPAETGGGAGTGVQAAWPPVEPGYRRLVRQLRVYRLDPFVLQVPGWTSRVMSILPRLADQGSMSPVRDPRPLGWSPAVWLVWVFFGLLLIALGVLGWRRRRLRIKAPPDATIALPAWMDAACGLQELLRAGLLESGHNRDFLDALAGLMRRFTAGRYLIGAREMTAAEIVDACSRRAYDPGPVRDLAGVIAASDGTRYHPADPDGSNCRAAATTFFRVLEQVRIRPKFVLPPADLALRADRALADLERELGARPAGAAETKGEVT
ncbi:hypothetical protein COW53_08870 [bacterium CG17_big_fil_post_rev_8_21_14_2_50_64_8]|nr:MAG: hypothetical protein COW53_08870 [bacterium CG17_big_fil_post_rev_8_21_14_2_50_64_8]PJA74708.1 MAG: hypothetical protein CO151_08950 [bacterium CG_4_9_14_3_um_filter_65_15]